MIVFCQKQNRPSLVPWRWRLCHPHLLLRSSVHWRRFPAHSRLVQTVGSGHTSRHKNWSSWNRVRPQLPESIDPDNETYAWWFVIFWWSLLNQFLQKHSHFGWFGPQFPTWKLSCLNLSLDDPQSESNSASSSAVKLRSPNSSSSNSSSLYALPLFIPGLGRFSPRKLDGYWPKKRKCWNWIGWWTNDKWIQMV